MTLPRLRVLWLLALGVCPVALAGAEVRIVDGNGGGEGLNDRTAAGPVGGNPGTSVGEQRLIAAQYAAALWSATLGNQVPIAVHVEFNDLDCSGGSAVLGSSGPSMLYGGDRFPAALANEQAGRDLDPGREEIDARFNSRVGRSDCAVTAWYPGLDNAAPPGSTDLATVFLHELAHGLGFIKSSSTFRGRARDGISGLLLSQLAGPDYDAAVRRPLDVSWIGPAVRAAKDAVLDSTDGVLYLPDGGVFPVARARFSQARVSVTAPLVLATDADGGTAIDACQPLTPVAGALVLAERNLQPDGGLVCLVAQRALHAQEAGAAGLLVRHGVPGAGPTAYTGDAGSALTIPVWGVSYEDGATLEQALAAGPTTVRVDGEGRRAGENLAGDVLLYTPSTYSEGSSVGHWDSSATPQSPDGAHHQPPLAQEPGPHPRGAAGRGLVPPVRAEHRGDHARAELLPDAGAPVHRPRGEPRRGHSHRGGARRAPRVRADAGLHRARLPGRPALFAGRPGARYRPDGHRQLRPPGRRALEPLGGVLPLGREPCPTGPQREHHRRRHPGLGLQRHRQRPGWCARAPGGRRLGEPAADGAHSLTLEAIASTAEGARH